MRNVCRVLSVVCLLALFSLPLAAQSEREAVSPVAGFLDSVWERLVATLSPFSPLPAVWEADEAGGELPDSPPSSSSQGQWDPLG